MKKKMNMMTINITQISITSKKEYDIMIYCRNKNQEIFKLDSKVKNQQILLRISIVSRLKKEGMGFNVAYNN